MNTSFIVTINDQSFTFDYDQDSLTVVKYEGNEEIGGLLVYREQLDELIMGLLKVQAAMKASQ